MQTEENIESFFKPKHWVIAGLTFLACLWLLFLPTLMNFESYWYAGGVEGFFNVSSIYNVFQPHFQMPNFSLYHPNHPLPHTIAYALLKFFKLFGLKISAIILLQFLNLVAGLTGAYVFYRIFYLISKDQLLSTVFMLTLATTPIFWFSAVTADVHLIGDLATFLAFYFIIKASDSAKMNKKNLYSLTFFYAAGYIFHLGPSIFAPVIILHFAYIFWRHRNWQSIRDLSFIGINTLWVFVLFYIVIFCYWYDIGFSRWWEIFTMQSQMPMTLSRTKSEIVRILQHSFTAWKSYFLGYISGENTALSWLRTILIFATWILSFLWFRKKTNWHLKVISTGWIFIAIIFSVLIHKHPKNLNYSMVILIPVHLIFATTLFENSTIKITRIVLSAWLLFSLSLNFTLTIFPKYSISEDVAFLAKKAPIEIAKGKKTILLVHEYNGFIPDAYYLNYHRGFKHDLLLFDFDPQLKLKLQKFLRPQRATVIITDILLPKTARLINSLGYQIDEKYSKQFKYPKNYFWFSSPARYASLSFFPRSFKILIIERQ